MSLNAVAEQLTAHAGLDRDDPQERRPAEALLQMAERVLADCLGLRSSMARGPKRGVRLLRLRVVLRAQENLVSAIEGLDAWTWMDLLEQLDPDRCAPPEGIDRDFEPAPFPALEELGRAAAVVEAALGREQRAPRDEGARFRDQAITELAYVFDRYAKPLNPQAYREALVGTSRTPGFIPIALRAAGFDVPTPPRKMLALIPQKEALRQRAAARRARS